MMARNWRGTVEPTTMKDGMSGRRVSTRLDSDSYALGQHTRAGRSGVGKTIRQLGNWILRPVLVRFGQWGLCRVREPEG
jgi:hypothetical protein